MSITVVQPLTGEVIDCPSINVLNKDGTKSTEVIMVLAQIGRHIVRDGFIRVRPLAGAVQHFRFDEPVLLTAESATAARTQIHSISQTIQTHGGGVVSADGLAAAPSSARAEQWLSVRLVPCTPDDIEQARARVARPAPPLDLAVTSEGKAPAAPSGLTATAQTSTTALLQWVDNANDEDGVTIERSDDGRTFAPCVTLGRNKVSHVIEGLIPGSIVAFRVRCYNGDGVSQYSNVASTRMPQAPVPLVNSGFSRSDALTDMETDKNERYRAFFQELINGLCERNFTQAREAQPRNYCQFSFEDSKDFNYKAHFTKTGVSISLYIEPSGIDVADRVAKCKAYYHALYSRRVDIERELGVALSWEERPGQPASEIAIFRDGAIEYDAQQLAAIRRWMIEQLVRFREVFSVCAPVGLAEDSTEHIRFAHRVPKRSTVSNSGGVSTRQDELAAAIRAQYPDVVCKKINRDGYVDLHLPSVHPRYGTHLGFNTAKEQIRFCFYVRDTDFVAGVVAVASDIEAYSQGLRPAGNPGYNSVASAVAAAMSFLKQFESYKGRTP